MATQFINLTPHTVNLHLASGEIQTIPSAGVARVAEVVDVVGEVDGTPLRRISHGEITNLPAPLEGVIYITSGLVASAAQRPDVVSPTDYIRNDRGHVVGCKALAVYA